MKNNHYIRYRTFDNPFYRGFSDKKNSRPYMGEKAYGLSNLFFGGVAAIYMILNLLQFLNVSNALTMLHMPYLASAMPFLSAYPVLTTMALVSLSTLCLYVVSHGLAALVNSIILDKAIKEEANKPTSLESSEIEEVEQEHVNNERPKWTLIKATSTVWFEVLVKIFAKLGALPRNIELLLVIGVEVLTKVAKGIGMLVFGLPALVWGLVALRKQEVKKVFANEAEEYLKGRETKVGKRRAFYRVCFKPAVDKLCSPIALALYALFVAVTKLIDPIVRVLSGVLRLVGEAIGAALFVALLIPAAIVLGIVALCKSKKGGLEATLEPVGSFARGILHSERLDHTITQRISAEIEKWAFSEYCLSLVEGDLGSSQRHFTDFCEIVNPVTAIQSNFKNQHTMIMGGHDNSKSQKYSNKQHIRANSTLTQFDDYDDDPSAWPTTYTDYGDNKGSENKPKMTNDDPLILPTTSSTISWDLNG